MCQRSLFVLIVSILNTFIACTSIHSTRDLNVCATRTENYFGFFNQKRKNSKNMISCQHWKKRFPNRHQFTKSLQKLLKLERNFCRTISFQSDISKIFHNAPSCFGMNMTTRSGTVFLIKCEIPSCRAKECIESPDKAQDYRGYENSVKVKQSGRKGVKRKKCSPWTNVQTLRSHKKYQKMYSDYGIRKGDNFCRLIKFRNYCKLDKNDKQQAYRGTVNHTRIDNKPCLSWDNPRISKDWPTTKQIVQRKPLLYTGQRNWCRNFDQYSAPWCWFLRGDGTIRYDKCKTEDCSNHYKFKKSILNKILAFKKPFCFTNHRKIKSSDLKECDIPTCNDGKLIFMSSNNPPADEFSKLKNLSDYAEAIGNLSHWSRDKQYWIGMAELKNLTKENHHLRLELYNDETGEFAFALWGKIEILEDTTLMLSNYIKRSTLPNTLQRMSHNKTFKIGKNGRASGWYDEDEFDDYNVQFFGTNITYGRFGNRGKLYKFTRVKMWIFQFGLLSDWSSWSACNCTSKHRVRSRRCDSPAPFPGSGCSGGILQEEETKLCNRNELWKDCNPNWRGDKEGATNNEDNDNIFPPDIGPILTNEDLEEACERSEKRGNCTFPFIYEDQIFEECTRDVQGSFCFDECLVDEIAKRIDCNELLFAPPTGKNKLSTIMTVLLVIGIVIVLVICGFCAKKYKLLTACKNKKKNRKAKRKKKKRGVVTRKTRLSSKSIGSYQDKKRLSRESKSASTKTAYRPEFFPNFSHVKNTSLEPKKSHKSLKEITFYE